MAKVQVNDSLIGRTVQLLNGSSSKITDTTTRGYKLASRSNQILATRLVKVGNKLVEIEKLTPSKIEDSGKGFANVIDAEAYEEIHGKPMKGAKSKSKTSGKGKSTKSGKGKSGKGKTSKSEKAEKPAKSKKTRKPKKQHIDSFADTKVLEPLISIVGQAVRDYLDTNFTYDGELDINTEVLAPEIVEDPNSPVIAINTSVVQDLPEQEIDEAPEITMSLKASKLVTAGLWEKSLKAQAKAETAFGAPLTLGALLESAKGIEFKFVGARKTEGGALLVFDATGDSEILKQLTISKAASLLSFVEDEEELDFDDVEQADDFDFDEDELVDGDELDEDENSEMASTLTEEVFEQFEGDVDAAIEWLLENQTFEVMATYVNENYEESREIKKILNKEDALGIAELIASTEIAVESEEDEDDMENPAFDLPEDDEDFDDGDDFGDEDGDDEDEILEGEFEEIDEDADEDEDEVEVEGVEDEILSADDIDAMSDRLIDENLVTPSALRKMSDDSILEMYSEHFQVEGDDDEEAELPDVDAMADELIDAGAVTPSALRKMDDEEIEAAYRAHVLGESEDDAEELDEDEMDDELSEDDFDDEDFDGADFDE